MKKPQQKHERCETCSHWRLVMWESIQQGIAGPVTAEGCEGTCDRVTGNQSDCKCFFCTSPYEHIHNRPLRYPHSFCRHYDFRADRVYRFYNRLEDRSGP